MSGRALRRCQDWPCALSTAPEAREHRERMHPQRAAHPMSKNVAFGVR
jgi:hypothetical protein